MNFNLEQVGWKAFQDLALTICRSELGVSVQSFSQGSDGGRDGASALVLAERSDQFGRIAIQCKHSSVEGSLTARLFEDELPKVRLLVEEELCDTYILVTNRRISAVSHAAIERHARTAGVSNVAIYGQETIERLLTDNKVLRGMVPRVYGLGDLSEILDERLYLQTRDMLDPDDLKKFVPTDAYRNAVTALHVHGFVMLLGGAASGKTSIMRSAAVHAADMWALESMWISGLGQFREHWNPNRNDQLFLVDDAFGATSFDVEMADAWNRNLPALKVAIRNGARFILTSRDYVFAAAEPALKRDELPVSHRGEVVINVEALSLDERRAMVYAHLKFGDQPRAFRAAIKPHLPSVTRSSAFLPESARRLGTLAFTGNLDPSNLASVSRFIAEPREYLRTVIASMEPRLRNALVVLVTSGGSLSSTPSDMDAQLLARCGLTHWQLAESIHELEGSFVRILEQDSDIFWTTRHPTVIDAVCDWMIGRSDLLDLYVAGAPDSVLTKQVSCGRQTTGAISLPERLWPVVMERILHPDCPRYLTLRFLLHRCSRRSLEISERYLPAVTEIALERLGSETPQDSDPATRLLLNLWSLGLISEQTAAQIASEVLTRAVRDLDPYPLRNPTVHELVLTLEDGPDRWANYLSALVERVNHSIRNVVDDRIRRYQGDVDRADAFAGLVDLLGAVTEAADEALERDALATHEVAYARTRIQEFVGDPEPVLRHRVETPEILLLRSIFGVSDVDNPFSDVDD